MRMPCRVLGMSGSLRTGSLNTALLRTAQEMAPDGVTIEIADLSDVPLYNEDVRQQGLPDAVVRLREGIAGADALLIATPEYNYSIPGVLKNAIDWASRPPDQPFDGKPVALMGTSPGRLGTARAQYHLRQCFVFLNAPVLNKPELMIGDAGTVFDDTGRMVDEVNRGRITKLLTALAEFAGNG